MRNNVDEGWQVLSVRHLSEDINRGVEEQWDERLCARSEGDLGEVMIRGRRGGGGAVLKGSKTTILADLQWISDNHNAIRNALERPAP